MSLGLVNAIQEQATLESCADGKTSVLDGDPFQPLWYNWVYANEGIWQSLDFLYSFYEPLILSGTIRFPDRYFLLHVDQDTLSSRKANDLRNRRSRFLKHLEFVEPQKRYFAELNRLFPGKVNLVSTIGPLSSTAEEVSEYLTRAEVNPQNEADLFYGLMNWLQLNSP